MGHWDNTAYIEHANWINVAAELQRILAEPGRRPIPRPRERVSSGQDPMQYGSAISVPLWGAAVLPVGGWTIIKTAPFELLCEQQRMSADIRLAVLASALRADVFQLNEYDSTCCVLVEASADGRVRAAGVTHEMAIEGKEGTYNGMKLDDECRFTLTSPPESVQRALVTPNPLHGSPARTLLAGICGDESADLYDNRIQVEYLIPHRALEVPGCDLFFLCV